jgi:DNA-binding transcriptional MocR family regulator
MVSADHPSARWLARLRRTGQPVYLAVVQAMEAAIRAGELQAGDQLPPQRAVAELLGVDLTTVTRAYAAARARGLIEGTVGRGTFVRRGATEDDAGLVDLSMNLPPPPDGLALGALLKDAVREILERTDPSALMAYHPTGGSLGQKTTAAAWLAPCLGDIAPERLLISPGAQTGLAAVLSALRAAGVGTLVVEPLVYPGLLSAARQFGFRLAVCAADDRGMEPEFLSRLCADEQPSAIYLVPATQNPTAVTMDLERRREIVEVARRADAWIIEDDPYSRLFDAPGPALATLAPERTFYLATLSKCLSPGLRIAFLAPPEGQMAEPTAESLRAIAQMPPPLMGAVATSWIREGVADRLLAGVRREARARRAIAAEVLPQARGAAEGIHVWLDLPPGWDAGRVHRVAQEKGLSLVTAETFAASDVHPAGLRISLGGPPSRPVLRGALESVAALLKGASQSRVVV